jgi:hypothetical protein
MRIFLIWAFILVIAPEIGIPQQRAERGLPRFDPPTVTKVAEAVYPLQSVGVGYSRA